MLHASRLFIFDRSELQKYSAVHSFLSLTPAAALNSRSPLFQARTRRIIFWYWLATFLVTRTLQQKANYIAKQNSCPCTPAFQRLPQPDHVGRIIQAEHNRLWMIIVSNFSYLLSRGRQNKVYVSTQIVSVNGLVPIHQISEVHVVSGAKWSHRFEEFDNGRLPLLALRRGRSRHALIHRPCEALCVII